MTSAAITARPARRRTVTIVLSGAGVYFQNRRFSTDRLTGQIILRHPDGSVTFRRLRPNGTFAPAIDLARSEIAVILD